MNTITLRIRYRSSSKVQVISIQTNEDRMSCEVLAWNLAKESTRQYMSYIGGEKSKHLERRYFLGQYKMIKNIIEAKV